MERGEFLAAFTYVAITREGKQKKGSIEAKDEDRVKVLLREKDMIPINVTEQGILTKDISISIGRSVKTRDLSIFCRQFSSILKAGVNIVEALDMLSQQTENKIFTKEIKAVQASVEKGETLADSMRTNKNVFPPILINMVEAGEMSGSLETSFNRMAVQFEKSARLKSKIKSAMTYPVIILALAFVILIFMSVAIIPQFTTMFDSMGSELPVITKAALAVSDLFTKYWYMLIAVIVIILVSIKLIGSTEQGKALFGQISIKAPIFGKLAVKNTCANFARTFSTLLSAGISISESLDITARSIKNVLFQKAIHEIKIEVERGVSISEPMKRSGLFPPMMYQMIKIGEETGNIEGMLEKAAEYYEEEVEITTGGLTKAMEPMFIIVVGFIVGFMVLALYMPMMDMYGGMENL